MNHEWLHINLILITNLVMPVLLIISSTPHCPSDTVLLLEPQVDMAASVPESFEDYMARTMEELGEERAVQQVSQDALQEPRDEERGEELLGGQDDGGRSVGDVVEEDQPDEVLSFYSGKTPEKEM